MVYNIAENLLLRLGKDGFVVSDAVNIRPSFVWEDIDAWKRHFTPRTRFLLLPWVLSRARWLGKRMKLSAGAVILLTDFVNSRNVCDMELKVSLRWPLKIINKYLQEIIDKGLVKPDEYEGCYTLSLEGISRMLFADSEYFSGRFCEMGVNRPMAYQRMVNEVLRQNNKPALPYRPVSEQFEWPVFPVELPEEEEEVDTSSSEDSADAEKEYPTDFFECLERMRDDVSSPSAQLALITVVDKCLQEDVNGTVRRGLETLGYEDLKESEKAVFLLLCRQFLTKGLEPMRFGGDDDGDLSEVTGRLRKAFSSLVTRGIAVVPPADTGSDVDSDGRSRIAGEGYLLSPDAAGAVFRGRDCVGYSAVCRQADVVRGSSVEKKTLYFTEKMAKDIDRLRQLMDPERSGELMQRLAGLGRKSLTCLFFGAPGVGKTELVRQLAAETGRDILVADSAKLSSCWVGDSEKNAREIFRSFKYLTKLSVKAPILLFNEADGIVTKRFTNVSRSADKSENAVQGIILQELETLEGIFIATTNLETNMDEAMDRRFLFKLHFETPTPEIRAKIIRAKMPWMDAATADAIAKEFCLSGGQIDNIACRCVIEQFSSGEDLSLETVRSLCREELSIGNRRNGGGEERRKIGFAI